MVYFKTNANLNQTQIENIRIKLNEVLSDDLNVVIDSGDIVWYSDDEIDSSSANKWKEALEFKEIFELIDKEIKSDRDIEEWSGELFFNDKRNYNNADITSRQRIYGRGQIMDYLELLRGN